MKTNILLIAGILTLGLVACNKDENLQPAGEQGQESLKGAYMQIQVVGPTTGIGTKTTPGEDGTEEGTAEENAFTNVRIILKPTGENTAAPQSFLINGSELIAVDVDADETVTGYATPRIEVAAAGTYEVFVIANDKSSSVWTTLTSAPSSAVMEDVTESSMQSQYAADNKFIMFNEADASDKISGEPITITAENTYENPARCSNVIRLDRLAVKIESSVKDGGITDLSAINARFGTETPVTAVALKGYKLLNGAKKVYLQQHWLRNSDDMTTGKTETDNWYNTLITPGVNYIVEHAEPVSAESDYYNTLTDFRTLEFDDPAAGSVVTKYTEVKDKYQDLPYYNPADPCGPIYCMENNPTYVGNAETNAKNGNTTGLVYQWQATVTGSDALAGENCFYAYNDEYFTTLAAIQAKYPGAFEDEDPMTDAKTELDNASYALSAAYQQGNGAAHDGISAWRAKYNVKVYMEGLMYYLYFIKDQNYVSQPAGATEKDHYYSVMRNTIYRLSVSGLGGIGTDIPGGWNPDVVTEEDVDKYPLYMIVEVKANPWVISAQDIILK